MRRTLLKLCILCMVGLVIHSQAWAQEQASDATASTGLDTFNLEDLLNISVVSASKVEQKQDEAPSILTVYTRKQIQDYGWNSFNEILYKTAGFFPSRDYDRRVVGSRGLYEGWNNNHILMLIDGVPMNDPMYGSAYTWDNTPVFFAKSVEVIRGPGSALYGTNAANGVLGIQTLSGKDMNGKAEATFRSGNKQTESVDVYTGGSGTKYSYFLGYSGMDTAGNSYESVDGSSRTDSNGDFRKFKVLDDRGTRYFFAKIEGEGDLKPLSIQYHKQDWSYQTGHGWLFYAPDFRESMDSHRQVLSVSYKPTFGKVSTDFTLQWQKQNNDWWVRYCPDGVDCLGYASANGHSVYERGIWEYNNFDYSNLFARAQGTYDLGDRATFLVGAEASRFSYTGDKAHYSNTVLMNFFEQTANGEMENAEGLMSLIKDKPIMNLGLYSQFASGDMLSKKVQMTFGLRFDNSTVKFDGTKAFTPAAGTGEEDVSFNQFSPRAAVVYKPNDNFSWKFMGGQAFRAPAPSEVAGVFTWALNNNIRNLKPEQITTYETGVDWKASKQLNVRANIYRTKFEDQIGYNASQFNLSTNIYTTTTMGLETEIYYASGKMSGFFNASMAQRQDEQISDTTVSEMSDEVTWAPAVTGNLGLSYQVSSKLKGTLLGSYIGEQKRRDSDNLIAANASERGESVDAAFVVDTNWQYRFGDNWQAGFMIRNLLDQEYHLIKSRDFAFDYRAEGRTYLANLSFNM